MSLRRIKYPDARLHIGQAAANAIDAPRNCVNMQGILYGLYVTEEGGGTTGSKYYRTREGVGDNPFTPEVVESEGTLWIDETVESTFRG